MGTKNLGPEAVLEAVEQATAADRADMVKRLTKQMLVDPSRVIGLDELVSQEVTRVLDFITDPERVGALCPVTGMVVLFHEAECSTF